jgi:hypothetical protein
VCNRLPAGSTVCPGKVVSKGGGTEDAPTGIEFGLSVQVGGGGGSAGDGGAVTLRNEGDIATEGQVAHAIVAHSIGGGGGDGGEGAPGIQAWTTNETANEIFEDQEKALTNFSVFTEVKVDVGGAAGASGDGGEVEVVNSGDLTVKGVPEAELATRRASLDALGVSRDFVSLSNGGMGIRAQSIGGGGGNGGAGAGGLTGLFTLGRGGSGGG